MERATTREYGFNTVTWREPLGQIPRTQKVWMSHGDVITKAPPGAKVVAESGNRHPAAMMAENYWAVQFHPEVAHTDHGIDFLKSFLFGFCKAKENWSTKLIEDHLLHDIRERVGNEKVLCALSGGVDSTVVATLLTRALG